MFCVICSALIQRNAHILLEYTPEKFTVGVQILAIRLEKHAVTWQWDFLTAFTKQIKRRYEVFYASLHEKWESANLQNRFKYDCVTGGGICFPKNKLNWWCCVRFAFECLTHQLFNMKNVLPISCSIWKGWTPSCPLPRFILSVGLHEKCWPIACLEELIYLVIYTLLNLHYFKR